MNRVTRSSGTEFDMTRSVRCTYSPLRFGWYVIPVEMLTAAVLGDIHGGYWLLFGQIMHLICLSLLHPSLTTLTSSEVSVIFRPASNSIFGSVLIAFASLLRKLPHPSYVVLVHAALGSCGLVIGATPSSFNVIVSNLA